MPYERVADRKARMGRIVDALQQAYPKSTCALAYETPFQLLLATAFSAQTTDVAVNRATRTLFAEFPSPAEIADAPLERIEEHLRGIGLWRNKAKNAKLAALRIQEAYGGNMPDTVDELTTLPGVGRKTATAVIGQAFGRPDGLTVDTHMLRIHRHLKFSTGEDPIKVAKTLEALVPREAWIAHTHRIIDHGRLVCVANRPRCGVCPLAEDCPSAFTATIGYKEANDARLPGSAKGLSWLHLEQH